MTCLPSRSPRARIASSVSSSVSRPRISSMSGMTGTGLKKCIPTNRSRRSRETASARRWIAIDEVFEAKIACLRRQRVEIAPEGRLDREILEDRLDDEVGVGDAPRDRPLARRAPSVASRSSWLRRPLATARSRLDAILSRPASARARSGSYSVTGRPIAAWTWAMPCPISPAPATKTRSIELAMATMVRGRSLPRGRQPRVVSSSNRSAAAYGSRRARRRPRGGPRSRGVLGVVEPRAQAVRDDRPDLRLGTRQSRARRLPHPPDGSVAVQRGKQFRHAVAGRGRRDQDLRSLRPRPRVIVAARRGRDQHRPELGGGPLRAGLVALVDHDQVGDLEQAGLDRLDLVAHLGRLEDDRRVRRGRDLDLALPGPDGLDQDQVETGGVEHRRCRRRGRRQTAGMTTRRHRPDEDVPVAGVGLHPHAIAQQGAARDRARRVDRDDRHRPTGRADLRDQRGDQRRLARPGRPGDPDEVRLARPSGRAAAARPRRPACGSRQRSGAAPGRGGRRPPPRRTARQPAPRRRQPR